MKWWEDDKSCAIQSETVENFFSAYTIVLT